MRILTNVHGTSPTGGLELQVLQVSRELVARGHRVDLLHVENGDLEAEYHAFCASVTRVPSVDYWFPDGRRGKLTAAAELLPAIWSAVRRHPDVIYCNRVFSIGWAVPAGRLVRAPVVCHLHGHTSLSPERIAFLNRRVDRFLIISEFVAAEWFASGLDPRRAELVHNGIDPDAYPPGGLAERAVARQVLDLPEDAFVVTFVGRVDREKGVDVLLRAWGSLGLDPRAGRLLVVGSSMVDHDGGAYRAELEALATDSVRFVAATGDVVTPLHAADIAVVPSTWDEPFGRTVIEALATGRPVLASRVGGIPEILHGSLSRFLFDRGDANGLAALLAAHAGWREEEPELASACTARVVGEFTLAHMVDRIEAALTSSR